MLKLITILTYRLKQLLFDFSLSVFFWNKRSSHTHFFLLTSKRLNGCITALRPQSSTSIKPYNLLMLYSKTERWSPSHSLNQMLHFLQRAWMAQVCFMSDSFCAGIMHCANPDPVGYRQTKDVSVTAKGGMECLAQTSDIDKAGSQSACREAQLQACIHTHARVCIHGCICKRWHTSDICICIQSARSQCSDRQLCVRPGHCRAMKRMKTHCPTQIS